MKTLANLINHISSNMPELSYIDEDYGQLEALQNENIDTYPLTFPSVLINVDNIDWSNTSDGNQIGQGNIRVRLLIDCYDDTHAGSMTTNKAADRQAVVHRLHSILEGHRPNEEGGLSRYKTVHSVGFHGIKIYDQYYSFTAKEPSHPQRETTAVRSVRLSVVSS